MLFIIIYKSFNTALLTGRLSYKAFLLTLLLLKTLQKKERGVRVLQHRRVQKRQFLMLSSARFQRVFRFLYESPYDQNEMLSLRFK